VLIIYLLGLVIIVIKQPVVCIVDVYVRVLHVSDS